MMDLRFLPSTLWLYNVKASGSYLVWNLEASICNLSGTTKANE